VIPRPYPRFYPRVPVRTKARWAPWWALCVIGLGVLADHGVIDLPSGPGPSTTRPRTVGAAPPSRAARLEIPAAYLRAYQHAARGCPGLSWSVLAAIGKHESDHGRTPLPGVHSGANWAGAAGPMQLGIGGKAGPTWQHYGDGIPGHVYRIGPAAKAAARKLCHDGARGGRDLPGALFAYNHSPAYVAGVLATARRYQTGGSR
jgi:hypothetical protein